MNELMTILSYDSDYSGAYWIGRIVGCVVMGFICKKICESKGYYGSENKGFLWGFFLGLIGVIVCACKKNRNFNNFNNNYQNPNMYGAGYNQYNQNGYNQYNQNGYNQNGYNQNGYNPNGYNQYNQNGYNGGTYDPNVQNNAGYDPTGAANGYVDLTQQSGGNNNNNYYNQ